MTYRAWWLVVVGLLLAATPAAAQLPVSILIEGRAGMALPFGDFASSGDGFATEPGPAFRASVAFLPVGSHGAFGGYQQSRFGCGQCATVGIDGTATLQGLEAGIHIGFPRLTRSAAGWVRGGIVHQILAFSSDDDRMSSEPAIGFTVVAGATVPLVAGLRLDPAIGLVSVPADFSFSELPDRSIDVTAITIDVGISFRF